MKYLIKSYYGKSSKVRDWTPVVFLFKSSTNNSTSYVVSNKVAAKSYQEENNRAVKIPFGSFVWPSDT